MEMHIVKWFTLRCLCGLLLLFVDVLFLFVCLFFVCMRVVGFFVVFVFVFVCLFVWVFFFFFFFFFFLFCLFVWWVFFCQAAVLNKISNLRICFCSFY